MNSQASKWKKFDKDIRVDRRNDADLDEGVVGTMKSDDSGQITEEKPRARPTRVLDKSGKKLRVFKKDSVSDSEEIAPPKKRKRMKLDRYDTSNKRIEDATPKQDGTCAILPFFKWSRGFIYTYVDIVSCARFIKPVILKRQPSVKVSCSSPESSVSALHFLSEVHDSKRINLPCCLNTCIELGL
jgi:hypothetical protein